jgi:hypothetical protein
MARIAPVPYFWDYVTFYMVGDFGKHIKSQFKAKYRRLDQDEYEKLAARVNAARIAAITGALRSTPGQPGDAGKDLPAGSAEPITDQEVVDLVFMDWDDMEDEDGNKLPYTKDNEARAFKALGCRAAVVTTFFDAHMKAPEKNSGEPSGTTTGTSAAPTQQKTAQT